MDAALLFTEEILLATPGKISPQPEINSEDGWSKLNSALEHDIFLKIIK
jgi:hypothetical protein